MTWTCNHCKSPEHHGRDCPDRLKSVLRRTYEDNYEFALDDGATEEQAIEAALLAVYAAGRRASVMSTHVPRCGTCRYCAEYAFEIGVGICTLRRRRDDEPNRVRLTEDYCSQHGEVREP